MHHPKDRIAHTTAFVTPVVEHWLEREIVQWVHPMKDRSDDPSHHERTVLPRSYTSLPLIFRGQLVAGAAGGAAESAEADAQAGPRHADGHGPAVSGRDPHLVLLHGVAAGT